MRRVWHVEMSAGVYEVLGEGTMVVCESVMVVSEAARGESGLGASFDESLEVVGGLW